ncbi:MAG: uracil-DNA glycosylase family protein [Thermotogae bacterium]|jgi:uracil-DNA glycosylase|nr:uracil-DNA glycosylase family protein [Thermotogota bacterium]MCL5033289.1 uracil-DNA glycosylase family protein [Thermotogota bacterium]
MDNIYAVMQNIIHCPLIQEVIDKSSGECSKIVKSQSESYSPFFLNHFQVPEPWRGHIEKANILFVSSNPGISFDENFPTWNWDMESIETFFITCFDKESKFTKDGIRYLKKDGTYSSAVRFWVTLKSIANEVIENAIPGTDYAMTEVVHCKSPHEYGVSEACRICSQRYLSSVISLSPAKVIIILGSTAKGVFNSYYNISTDENHKLIGPIQIENGERYIVFLPHPNSFKPHKLSTNLSLKEIEILRQFVKGKEVQA